VAEALGATGLRAELDDRTESVGRKIREAELRKVPYMLVVGDREAEQRAVSLRRHREGDLGTIPLDEAVASSPARSRTAALDARPAPLYFVALITRSDITPRPS
jgi:threonyl-tRNA synthetase